MKETPRWWFLRTAAVVSAWCNGSMVAFAGLIASLVVLGAIAEGVRTTGAALTLGAGSIGLTMDERLVSRVFGIRSSFDSQLFVGGVPPSGRERAIVPA